MVQFPFSAVSFIKVNKVCHLELWKGNSPGSIPVLFLSNKSLVQAQWYVDSFFDFCSLS